MSIPLIRAEGLRGKIDFAVITIREDEEEAILDRFPPSAIIDTSPPSSAAWPYAISYVSMQSGHHAVALVRCLRQGNNESQRVAADIIRDLQPTWIFAVGIAGAVPDSDFTLGDVIVSSQVLDITVSAARQGGIEEYATTGSFLSRPAESLVAGLGARRQELDGWNTPESLKCERPPVDPDRDECYGGGDYEVEVRNSLRTHFGGAHRAVVRFFA
jgi:hypothetical protein